MDANQRIQANYATVAEDPCARIGGQVARCRCSIHELMRLQECPTSRMPENGSVNVDAQNRNGVINNNNQEPETETEQNESTGDAINSNRTQLTESESTEERLTRGRTLTELDKRFSRILKRALKMYRMNAKYRSKNIRNAEKATKRANKAFAVYKVANVSLTLVKKAKRGIPLTVGELAFLNAETVGDAIEAQEILNQEMQAQRNASSTLVNEAPGCSQNDCCGVLSRPVAPPLFKTQKTQNVDVEAVQQIETNRATTVLHNNSITTQAPSQQTVNGDGVSSTQVLDQNNNPPNQQTFNDAGEREEKSQSTGDNTAIDIDVLRCGQPTHDVSSRLLNPADIRPMNTTGERHTDRYFPGRDINFRPELIKTTPVITLDVNPTEMLGIYGQNVKIGRRVHPATQHEPPQQDPVMYQGYGSADNQPPPVYEEATGNMDTDVRNNVTTRADHIRNWNEGRWNPLMAVDHPNQLGALGANGTHCCEQCYINSLAERQQLKVHHVVSHSEIDGGALESRVRIACDRKAIEEKIEELENTAIMKDKTPDGRFIHIHSSIQNGGNCIGEEEGCRSAVQKQKICVIYPPSDGKNFNLRCNGICGAIRSHILLLQCTSCGEVENCRIPPQNLAKTKLITGKLDLREISEREGISTQWY